MAFNPGQPRGPDGRWIDVDVYHWAPRAARGAIEAQGLQPGVPSASRWGHGAGVRQTRGVYTVEAREVERARQMMPSGEYDLWRVLGDQITVADTRGYDAGDPNFETGLVVDRPLRAERVKDPGKVMNPVAPGAPRRVQDRDLPPRTERKPLTRRSAKDASNAVLRAVMQRRYRFAGDTPEQFRIAQRELKRRRVRID